MRYAKSLAQHGTHARPERVVHFAEDAGFAKAGHSGWIEKHFLVALDVANENGERAPGGDQGGFEQTRIALPTDIDAILNFVRMRQDRDGAAQWLVHLKSDDPCRWQGDREPHGVVTVSGANIDNEGRRPCEYALHDCVELALVRSEDLRDEPSLRPRFRDAAHSPEWAGKDGGRVPQLVKRAKDRAAALAMSSASKRPKDLCHPKVERMRQQREKPLGDGADHTRYAPP